MKPSYKEILNELPILVYISAPDGIETLFYNSSWTRFTGYTLEEMRNGWENVVHPDDIKQISEAVETAAPLKCNYQVEFRLYSKYFDSYRWVLANCHPILNDRGEISSWVGYISDIHDAKLTSHELELKYELEISKRTARIKELEKEVELHKTVT